MSLDLDKAIATLKSCQIIAEEDVKSLCNKAKEILMEEQNVHHVSTSRSPRRSWGTFMVSSTICWSFRQVPAF